MEIIENRGMIMKDIMIKMDKVTFEYKSYIEDEIVAAVKDMSLEVKKR